jgi:hypothetical protein
MKTANLLSALPAVVINDAEKEYNGTYDRDENGIINAIVDAFEADDPEDEQEVAQCNFLTNVMNQQYTILHDNFGIEHAECANYGWVSDDDSITTKIRTINGYSTIETKFDDESMTVVSHVIKLINDNGDYEDEVSYVAGNAAVAA